jgi:NAD(P)-dependent dehydrogenase (short-subunit alcohol dehydrogenase family)
MNIENNTVLVTGSTDGVGRLVARRLADQGARVLIQIPEAIRAVARVTSRGTWTAPSRKSVQAAAGSGGKRHPEAHRRECAAARQRTFRSRLRSGGGKHVYLRGNAEVLK